MPGAQGARHTAFPGVSPPNDHTSPTPNRDRFVGRLFALAAGGGVEDDLALLSRRGLLDDARELRHAAVQELLTTIHHKVRRAETPGALPCPAHSRSPTVGHH